MKSSEELPDRAKRVLESDWIPWIGFLVAFVCGRMDSSVLTGWAIMVFSVLYLLHYLTFVPKYEDYFGQSERKKVSAVRVKSLLEAQRERRVLYLVCWLVTIGLTAYGT